MEFNYLQDENIPIPGERLARRILMLGVAPELVTELDMSDVRVVLGDVAKVLAAATHPDHNPVGKTIPGVETGDLNAISSDISYASDSDLLQAAEYLRRNNMGAIIRRELENTQQERSLAQDKSLELASRLIEVSPAVAEISGSYYFAYAERSLSYGTVIIEAENGKITNAVITEDSAVLVRNLPKKAQTYIYSKKPNLDDASVTFYVDSSAAKASGLDAGQWHTIQTAKSKKDPTNKVAALVTHDTDTGYESDLVNAEYIGTYSYEEDTNLHTAEVEHAEGEVNGIFKLSHSQAAMALSKGRIELGQMPQDANDDAYGLYRQKTLQGVLLLLAPLPKQPK